MLKKLMFQSGPFKSAWNVEVEVAFCIVKDGVNALQDMRQ